MIFDRFAERLGRRVMTKIGSVITENDVPFALFAFTSPQEEYDYVLDPNTHGVVSVRGMDCSCPVLDYSTPIFFVVGHEKKAMVKLWNGAQPLIFDITEADAVDYINGLISHDLEALEDLAVEYCRKSIGTMILMCRVFRSQLDELVKKGEIDKSTADSINAFFEGIQLQPLAKDDDVLSDEELSELLDGVDLGGDNE